MPLVIVIGSARSSRSTSGIVVRVATFLTIGVCAGHNVTWASKNVDCIWSILEVSMHTAFT